MTHVFKTRRFDGKRIAVCVNCGQGFHSQLRWITPCRAEAS